MIGLVLEGGGTKGAYHVGAIQAMLGEGIEIGAVTGTSIGAINGAMFACGKFDRLVEIYSDFDPRFIINAEEDLISSLSVSDLNWKTIGDLGKAAVPYLLKGGIDITPLKKLVYEEIDEEEIRNSPVRFGLVTVDMLEKKAKELLVEEIPRGELQEYILASAYLPYFKVEDKRRYLDGGFFNNIPLDLLLRSGPVKKAIIVRTSEMSIHQSLKRDVETVIIQPSMHLGYAIQLDPQKMLGNMQMGYYDTLRELRGLPGDFFCVEEVPEDFFLKWFCRLPKERFEELAQWMMLDSKLESHRFFFEEMLPIIERLLEKRFLDYESLGFALLERLAVALGMNRYRCYDFSSFVQEILGRLKEAPPEEDLDMKDRLSLLLAKTIPVTVPYADAILLNIGKILLGGENESTSAL